MYPQMYPKIDKIYKEFPKSSSKRYMIHQFLAENKATTILLGMFLLVQLFCDNTYFLCIKY